MKNVSGIKRILTLTLATMLFLSLGACSKIVNALDYTLENQIYEAQTGPSQTPSAEVSSAEPSEIQEDADTADSPSETPENEVSPEESPESTAADAPEESPESTAADAPEKSPESTAADTPEETPENTAAVTPEKTPENTAEKAGTFIYTIKVSDPYGVTLNGARVTLYSNDTLMYTAITGSNGQASWTLPSGCEYKAKAEMDGYAEQKNSSVIGADNLKDFEGDIVLCIIAHTLDGTTETTEPPSTPEPVPTTRAVKVTITAQDKGVQLGDTGFTLLDGVMASDQDGTAVYVWVLNDGGFSIKTPGAYTVSYAAMQGDTMISASRTVTVIGTAATKTAVKANAPSGSSIKRYQQLLAYRNDIYTALTQKMQYLSSKLEEKIQALTVGKTNVRLMKETLLTDDDSDSEEDSQVNTVVYSQVDNLSVTNWSDILAVFIAKSSLNVDDPLDLMELRNISLDGLDEVFWDMASISVLQTFDSTDVLLHSKTYKDMAGEYSLSEKRTNLLYELKQPEFQRVFASLTGNKAFENLTSPEIQTALSKIPKNLSVQREKVVEMAYSLVGKITYFWGGKYNALGWNPGWGLPRVVTSGGSKTSGTTRHYGLDCSGFVSWVFINAAGNTSVLNVIGNGSSNQWAKTESIGWDKGQPGDLAFLAVPGEKHFNHVGVIVAARKDGSYLVAHCSSSRDGVVVTEAWSSGFRYIRRPIIYKKVS